MNWIALVKLSAMFTGKSEVAHLMNLNSPPWNTPGVIAKDPSPSSEDYLATGTGMIHENGFFEIVLPG